MKSWLNRISIFCLLAVALFSCDKDEDQLTVAVDGNPALSASATSLELKQEIAAENVVTFSWNAPNLNWSNSEIANPNAVKYELQIDRTGGDFSGASTMSVGSSLEKGYTVEEFNRILGNMELPAGEPASVDVRLRAQLGDNVEPFYSNVVTVTATPYLDLKEYPSLYVPGSYQGWSPGTAPLVASVNDDDVYEGYFYFPDAENKFKLTSERDWDESHGDAGDGTSGELVIGGGGDIIVNGAGYYLVKVDLNKKAWSAQKTVWGVIGDATSGGWDADQDLIFDEEEQVWKATLPLTTGAIKFRANDSWDLDYGDKNGDGFLDRESDNNIAITEAGTYEITLNLSAAGNYRYKLKKQ